MNEMKKNIKEKNFLAKLNLNSEMQKISKQMIPVLLRNDEKVQEFEKYQDSQEFLERFPKEKEAVLLILGSAGSGKSTILQSRFLKSVEEWNLDKPIPLFMNLANEIDILKEFKRQQDLLGVKGIKLKTLQASDVLLFLDGFDESKQTSNLVDAKCRCILARI